MSTEATLESVYEAHAAELARLKADYTRELNGKLEQINKQAETLRKYMVAMDGIYNHNEAARQAVEQHFGTVHPQSAFDALKDIK